MTDTIHVLDAEPRVLAAVRRQVRIGEVARAFGPALDKVWAFLRAHPGTHTGGHNVFLYRHSERRSEPMEVAFGVEVPREFPPDGEVECVRTPAGRVVVAVHRGPYQHLRETHDAIHAYCAERHLAIGGFSWEVYGDHREDPAQLETTVAYLVG